MLSMLATHDLKLIKENTSFVSNLAHSLILLNGKYLPFSQKCSAGYKTAERCKKAYLEDTGFGGERGEIIGGNQNVLIAK